MECAKTCGRAYCSCCQFILAFLCPPLAVYLKYGFMGEFWITVGLTLLFYIPGIIYAMWVLFIRPRNNKNDLSAKDSRRGGAGNATTVTATNTLTATNKVTAV